MSNAPDKPSKSEARPRHLHGADLHGIGRLGLHAVDEVLALVESLHARLMGSATGPVSGLAYRRARAASAWVGRLVDDCLAPRPGAAHPQPSSAEREAVLAALNGVIGDFLASSGNTLAIPMRLRRHGRPLRIERAALAGTIPHPGGKLLILAHGLCRCDLQWRRNHHDHGEALARDLGYVPLYLHYNSGQHVSANGRELSRLLDSLVREWPVPVEEVAILAHSMGGLVARSACHYGRQSHHAWLPLLRHMVFLGTPHHGAPLERTGNWLTVTLGRNRFTAPFARLGQLRSAGITDLRYGNLLDEDWEGCDRFEHAGDRRRRVPLPRGVRCYVIAGSTGRRLGDMRDRLLGDGVIPLDTALGRHPDPALTLGFPESRTWIGFGIHHLDLLSRVEVYRRIRAWLGGEPDRG
ncbi:GPI inositol-deacylase [Massilia sp. G4R7]|uniref:GPI inositol-deacylase n=1 Tax=Massilia phyllostachyos TaxID=2898585 RepID=A0ABS8QD04_9BURK|nr:GPI inositol-deacylase [Massilia phyllostachyos]MCD2519636.1 GPI inositol-deacylase [Massilia phyllostachyos]